MAKTPAALLIDAAGNALSTPVRDGVRRLAVDVSQKEGKPLSVVVGPEVPSNLNRYVNTLVAFGGSPNLVVNGSVTPVHFDFVADPTNDISLAELRFVAACQDITFDGASFGGLPVLANGILAQLINGDGTQTIFNIRQNEDFLFFPSPVGLVLNNTGPKDVLAAGFYMGGSVLRAGTADKVRVTVRDNLTGGAALEFKYLQARVYGVKAA